MRRPPGSAELAVVRGLGGEPVLCEHGVPDGFSGATKDRAELREGLRDGATVILLAGSADMASELLNNADWREGLLLLIGTGDAVARQALDSVEWLGWPKVRYVDLEFIPPRLVADGPGYERLEGGLGLIEVSPDPGLVSPRRAAAISMLHLLPRLRTPHLPPRIAAQRLEEECARREQADRMIAELQASLSWRVTMPLRAARSRVKR